MGAIGFKIQLDGMILANLGDMLLPASEWQATQDPDVLKIPIGGAAVHNNMDKE